MNLHDAHDSFFAKYGGHDAGEALGVAAGFEHRELDWKVRKGVERKRKAVRTLTVEDWYLSPYMTCKECNTIMFVNEGPLRLRIQQNIKTRSAFSEAMPKCSGCGCTHAYEVGVSDFSSLIEASRFQLYLDRHHRATATLLVQSKFRGHRNRHVFLSRVAERKRIENALKNAALKVQTNFRGRLGWRRHRTIRFLKRLYGAHAMVLLEAQHNDFGSGERVFWYKRAQERKLLFKDYAILVKRTGNTPPKLTVERNIFELHRRVHLIECRYAQKVQARYRGLIGRKAAWNYRQQLARQLEHELHAALRIQRTTRGWLGWLRAFKRALYAQGLAVKQEYLKEASAGWLKDKINSRASFILDSYRRERAEEAQLRYADRIPYGTAEGLNMKAFMESMYNRPETLPEMTEYARDKKVEGKAIVQGKKDNRDRQRYILDKYEENAIMKHYWKAEMSSDQADDLRWIINLSTKRVGMAKRIYGSTALGKKVTEGLLKKSEKRIQAMANKIAKQRMEAALAPKLGKK